VVLSKPPRTIRARPAVVAAALVASLAVLVPGARPEDPVTDLDRNASQWNGTQAEVSIAVDRFRPGIALACAMNLFGGKILAMSSLDAGETWTQSEVTVGQGGLYDADPMVAFDSGGTAFLAKIPVDRNEKSVGIEVARSFDFGRSWEPAVRISSQAGKDDKVILAVDDEPESPYRDRIYVAWKWPEGRVYFSRSLDRGQTFSAPRLLESAQVSGLDMAVAADGTIYLAFHDNPRKSIRVMRSTDGGETFSASNAAATVRAGWYVVPPAQCQRMALVHASVAVDRSPSPNRGSVYLTWPDYAPGVSDSQCSNACAASSPCAPSVYFSRSTDGGAHWSPPAIVHEPGGGVVDRFHQWIRADPADGAVYVAYKDSRNDPARLGTDVYLSRSTDGGASWEPSLRLSSVTSRAGVAFQAGDYQSLAAASGNVYAAWADFRLSPLQGEIFVRRVFYGELFADRGPAERVPRERPAPRPRP
jgi:hypothetical protein